MLKETAFNLINDIDLDAAVETSFKDFHAKGLNYICLHRSSRFTAKLYYLRPGEHAENPDGLLVNPHTHAYNFSTYCLFGQMENHIFSRVTVAPATPIPALFVWHEVQYATHLNPNGRGSSRLGRCKLVRESNLSRSLKAGESYSLNHNQIHSISVSPTIPTALLLFQHADVDKPHTSLFMREKALPPLDGLYRRYTADEIRATLAEIRLLMQLEIGSARPARPA